MLTKLKPKSEFSRNVLTLMTGTTIAQAIPIAIMLPKKDYNYKYSIGKTI